MWDGYFFQIFRGRGKENLLDDSFLYLVYLLSALLHTKPLVLSISPWATTFSSQMSKQRGTKQAIIKNLC